MGTRRGGWLATTAASSANYSLLCAWPRLSLWRLPIPQPAICARRSSTRAFEKLLLSADSFVYSTPTRRHQQEEQEEQEEQEQRKLRGTHLAGSKKCDSSANAPSDWERSMGGEGAAGDLSPDEDRCDRLRLAPEVRCGS